LGPPVLAAGNLTASDAAAISAKVSATDPNGSALSYSMTGAPSGLGISTAGLLTWAKPVKGSYTLTIGAKDALGLSATAKYTLTVS
jgi:hypothetical protein